jgi:hypothetical protein
VCAPGRCRPAPGCTWPAYSTRPMDDLPVPQRRIEPVQRNRSGSYTGTPFATTDVQHRPRLGSAARRRWVSDTMTCLLINEHFRKRVKYWRSADHPEVLVDTGRTAVAPIHGSS